MKTAIIYDWMDKWGGVERMLLVLNEMYPEADWYTSYVDEKQADWTKKITGRKYSSFIQKFPSFIRKNRILSLPFFPYAFESFDLSGYELVISVTSSFAKGVITRPDTKHMSILLTPTRWLWGQISNYERGLGNYELLKPLKRLTQGNLRKWDYLAAHRPDNIISISQTVAMRCHKYYGRKSEVLYPPFDVDYWQQLKIDKPEVPETEKGYFLVVSRLEPYKKVDLVIEAFQKLPDNNLIIVGKGSQKYKLQSVASKNIIFLEDLSDPELAYLYTHAQALIMPQEEDFGYVALEAQSLGCPVLAYSKGGASETVADGIGGKLLGKQESGVIREAVADFKRDTYNLDDIRRAVRQFSKDRFIERIRSLV